MQWYNLHNLNVKSRWGRWSVAIKFEILDTERDNIDNQLKNQEPLLAEKVEVPFVSKEEDFEKDPRIQWLKAKLMSLGES